MASCKNRGPSIATGVLGWLLRGAPCGAMPPQKAPKELLCFFGTRDVSRRTAIANCSDAELLPKNPPAPPCRHRSTVWRSHIAEVMRIGIFG